MFSIAISLSLCCSLSPFLSFSSSRQPHGRLASPPAPQHAVPPGPLHPPAERRLVPLPVLRGGPHALLPSRRPPLRPSLPRQPHAPPPPPAPTDIGLFRRPRGGVGLPGVPSGRAAGHRALLLGLPRLVGPLRRRGPVPEPGAAAPAPSDQPPQPEPGARAFRPPGWWRRRLCWSTWWWRLGCRQHGPTRRPSTGPRLGGGRPEGAGRSGGRRPVGVEQPRAGQRRVGRHHHQELHQPDAAQQEAQSATRPDAP